MGQVLSLFFILPVNCILSMKLLDECIKVCYFVEPHIIHVRLVIYGAVMVTDKQVKTLGESR